jgi:fused signal recognition particle receptor
VDLWGRLRDGLARTRTRLGDSLAGLMSRRGPVDAATLEELESALLAADVGPATTERLIATARERMGREDLDLGAALQRSAAELLAERRASFEPGAERPWVALVMGVNGAGKTTLAGKLAAAFARSGRSTLLIAADTFRAAATEQLATWAERAGAAIVRATDGADPAAVVHDGLAAARARKVDVVLVDTAGRLHTKHNLMAELEKIARVCRRSVEGAPHHTLLVLDATVGQNALAQARDFDKTVPVTSLAINKLDGTARGGAVLSIAGDLGLPISVVGIGEGVEDWAPFDPEAFAKGLFARGSLETSP